MKSYVLPDVKSGHMAMGLLTDCMHSPHKAALAITMVTSHLVDRESVRDLKAATTA